jgi:hypothetical protein
LITHVPSCDYLQLMDVISKSTLVSMAPTSTDNCGSTSVYHSKICHTAGQINICQGFDRDRQSTSRAFTLCPNEYVECVFRSRSDLSSCDCGTLGTSICRFRSTPNREIAISSSCTRSSYRTVCRGVFLLFCFSVRVLWVSNGPKYHFSVFPYLVLVLDPPPAGSFFRVD